MTTPANPAPKITGIISAEAAADAEQLADVLRAAGWRVEPPIEHTRIPTGHVMTDKLRERICQWVRDNDLDPSDIPIDADIQIGEDTITTDVMVRGEDGKAVVAGHRVLRERITVPLRTPWRSA